VPTLIFLIDSKKLQEKIGKDRDTQALLNKKVYGCPKLFLDYCEHKGLKRRTNVSCCDKLLA
jgi:hypothetical protein